ncbi:MAG: hypothetical protein WD757_00580 [Actinomycetota bacterium]
MKGEEFADLVRARYELNEAESVLVDQIAEVLDVLQGGGLALTEQRHWRTLLSRLLGQLALPEVGDGKRPTVTSRKAATAARGRWRREVVRDVAQA